MTKTKTKNNNKNKNKKKNLQPPKETLFENTGQ